MLTLDEITELALREETLTAAFAAVAICHSSEILEKYVPDHPYETRFLFLFNHVRRAWLAAGKPAAEFQQDANTTH